MLKEHRVRRIIAKHGLILLSLIGLLILEIYLNFTGFFIGITLLIYPFYLIVQFIRWAVTVLQENHNNKTNIFLKFMERIENETTRRKYIAIALMVFFTFGLISRHSQTTTNAYTGMEPVTDKKLIAQLDQEARDESNVKMSVLYNAKDCANDYPLAIIINNSTNKTINKIDFRIGVYQKGYSDNLVNYYGNYTSYKIINPFESFVVCFKIPPIDFSQIVYNTNKNNTNVNFYNKILKNFEYTIEYKNVSFNAGYTPKLSDLSN